MASNFFDVPGFESIDFQFKSNLGSKMEKVFQEIVDFRDAKLEQYKKAAPYDINVTLGREIQKMIMTVSWKKLHDVIKSECGLDFCKLNLYGYDGSINGLFAVEPLFNDDVLDTISMQSDQTGVDVIPLYYGPVTGRTEEAAKEMDKLSTLLNLKTSKISAMKAGKCNIQVTLHFDIGSAFLSDMLVTDANKTGFMTAREITAVILHEIGHVLTFIEHANQRYMCLNNLNRLLDFKDLKSSADLRAVAEGLQKHIIPAFQRFINVCAGIGDKKVFSVCTSSLKFCVTVFNALSDKIFDITSEEDNGTIIGTILVNTLCLAGHVTMLSGLSILFAVTLLINGFYDQTYFFKNPDADIKDGDRRANSTNVFAAERWADDFAARHGYGPELATALIKIVGYFDENRIGPVWSRVLQKSTLYCWAYACMNACARILNYYGWFFNDRCPIYECMYDRIKRIREDVYAAFKHMDGAPGPLVNAWIKQVDDLNRAMEEAKPSLAGKTVRLATGIVLRLLNVRAWNEYITHGDLERDYADLQNAVDAMKDNSLFYWSAKFKNRK